jgi:biopolymer transport protein ExbD
VKIRGTLKEEEKAEVQMAPLIDCVFILLIFFLVTSMLQKPHNELALQVPFSGIGEVKSEEQNPLVITLTSKNPDPVEARESTGPLRDPFIVMDGEEMTKALLERRLRQVAQENPNRRIRIDSDPYLVWRHVVPVLDLCRFHGLTRVDIRMQ